MSENDARPNKADPVGRELRGLAVVVPDEVAAVDAGELRARARATQGRRRRRMSVTAQSITAAAVVAAALLVIVLRLFGGVHQPAITNRDGPSHTRLASHASTVGGVTFVSYNVNQVVTQAPSMRVRSATIKYPDLDANRAAIAFGAGSAWVLESAKPLGGPARPIGNPDPSDCGALVRLDPSTMAATKALSMPGCPEALAFSNGSVWVLSFKIGVKGYRLTQVDPTSLAARSTTVIDGGANGVTLQGDTGAKYLYVAATGATVAVAAQTANGTSQIVTLNAKTLATIGSVTVPETHGLAAGFAANRSAAWLGTTSGWVYRINPRTGTIAGKRQLGASVLSLSASNRAIWMTIARLQANLQVLIPASTRWS